MLHDIRLVIHWRPRTDLRLLAADELSKFADEGDWHFVHVDAVRTEFSRSLEFWS